MDEQRKQSDENLSSSQGTQGSVSSAERADELEFAPLANLRGSAESTDAQVLVSHLAERYPRRPGNSEPLRAPQDEGWPRERHRSVSRRVTWHTVRTAEESGLGVP
jgi:hypothetical protein